MCVPSYSLGYANSDIDEETMQDIFGGDTVRGGYGVEEEDDWVDVPINLLPVDDECTPMQDSFNEPEMMKLHEEYRSIEVIVSSGNNKCDFYAETQGFECVPYYQCDGDGTIITDGAGLIDIRFGGDEGPELALLDSTDLMCPSSLDICCKNPEPESGPLTQEPEGPVQDPMCIGHPCGRSCGTAKICDGNGICVDALENPCLQHGCEGKSTGETCIYQGDIAGYCSARGVCGLDPYIPSEEQNEQEQEQEQECVGQPCGAPCESHNICDGNGGCVDVLENPCLQHGCEGKSTGDECIMGDILGYCNAGGECGIGDDVVIVQPYTAYTPRCGKRNNNGLGVKVSGYNDDEAQFGEWPHICAVLKKEIIGGNPDDGYGGEQQQQEEVLEEILVFTAGASLIAPGVVMTAAHKVKEFESAPGQLVVRCGEWDTQTEGEPLAHQDRNVNLIVTHPEFNIRNLGNTIGLLFLSEDFQLADHIDTICLPEYQENFETSPECFVKGWGKDIFGKEGQYQVVLKEVKLPMVPVDQCLTWLKATRLGRRFRLDPSFVCAGGEAGKDACRGDGGGPLVCPANDDPSRFVQVGVVAWGIGCGEENVPGVYTSVAEEVCWIDWAMRCHLGESYSLQYGSECQDWLANKQRHRAPPIKAIYNQCQVTWPERDRSGPYSQQTETDGDIKSYGGKKGTSSLPEKIISQTKTKASPQTKQPPSGY